MSRRPFTSMDRFDSLGLRALSDEYAAPTREQILSKRATDADLVDQVRERLQASGDSSIVDRFSPAEQQILADLERRALAGTTGDHR